MRSMLAVLALALLTGCATLIQQVPRGAWIPLEPGGRLVLHRALTIPPGRTRVFFVNGGLSPRAASYRTVCALEVRRLDRAEPQRIPAGSYRIDRIDNYWTQVVAVPPAQTLAWRLAGRDGGGGYQMIRTGFRFRLEDPDQNNIKRLTCLGVLDEPAQAYPPSLAEIDGALGGLATWER